MNASTFLQLFEFERTEAPPATFVLPHRAEARGDTMVWVNKDFDYAWRQDTMWVGPGGTGDAIKGRYENFQKFLVNARIKGVPIEVSEVNVDRKGAVHFINGRHRYAVLKASGATTVPVAMSPESLRNAEDFGYLAR